MVGYFSTRAVFTGSRYFAAQATIVLLSAPTISVAASAECPPNFIPYDQVGVDCPDLNGDACVRAKGDILIDADAWRRLSDGEALPPYDYEFRYVVNRAESSVVSEAVVVRVIKDFGTEAVEIDGVRLSRNLGHEFNARNISVMKPDYQTFHTETDDEAGDELNEWHDLDIDFPTLDPKARRRVFSLSAIDAALNDRDPHMRLYTFESDRLSCIPFDLEWQEEVDSIEIVVHELVNNDRSKFVARKIIRKDSD